MEEELNVQSTVYPEEMLEYNEWIQYIYSLSETTHRTSLN